MSATVPTSSFAPRSREAARGEPADRSQSRGALSRGALSRGSLSRGSLSRGPGLEAVQGLRRGGQLSAGSPAAAVIRRRGTGRPLSALERESLPRLVGYSLDWIRIFDSRASHEAARELGARAFTVGGSIYFGENEYRPHQVAGRHLLAHEVAHAVQQRGMPPPTGTLEVSAPDSPEEREAERFADAVLSGAATAPKPRARPRAARVMRAIRFTRSNDTFSIRQAGVDERADTFDVAAKTGDEHFIWESDVTIHGDPGDNFGDWEIGPLQVVRKWRANIYYGHGKEQTVHRGRAVLPARDAVAGETSNWYDSSFVARGFARSGDSRHGDVEDSPGLEEVSFTNPQPKGSTPTTQGRFEFVQASVAYLSARDSSVSGASGFRPLAHVPWRIGMAGVWDSTRPVGQRFLKTHGGKPTHGPVAPGVNSKFPPMFGGSVAADTVTWTLA